MSRLRFMVLWSSEARQTPGKMILVSPGEDIYLTYEDGCYYFYHRNEYGLHDRIGQCEPSTIGALVAELNRLSEFDD